MDAVPLCGGVFQARETARASSQLLTTLCCSLVCLSHVVELRTSEGVMYRLQWSWDLKMCPHFRGCYVQASVELGPEDVSSFQRVLCTGFSGVGT